MSGFDDEALKQLCREIHARIEKPTTPVTTLKLKFLKTPKKSKNSTKKSLNSAVNSNVHHFAVFVCLPTKC